MLGVSRVRRETMWYGLCCCVVECECVCVCVSVCVRVCVRMCVRACYPYSPAPLAYVGRLDTPQVRTVRHMRRARLEAGRVR